MPSSTTIFEIAKIEAFRQLSST